MNRSTSNILYLILFWVCVVSLFKLCQWLITIKWLVLVIKLILVIVMVVFVNLFIYILIDCLHGWNDD